MYQQANLTPPPTATINSIVAAGNGSARSILCDIEKALSKAVAGGFNGTHQLSQVVRKTIGSWVGEEHRRKPMIIPLVVEV